jgi:methylase of polypeptide subunit release factors
MAHPRARYMPYRFARPVECDSTLASFVDEASRLRAFSPPFRFTSFFSPEDTLLCICAAEAALAHARLPGSSSHQASHDSLRIAELTTGSGLVGLHLLRIEHGSRLAALDVDPVAVDTARRNAKLFGLQNRARFDCIDLWSDNTESILSDYAPHLVICNPPYVPEPPNQRLDIEAGSGEDGTAHLMRTLELVGNVKPRAMALSWCSLSDPARVVTAAEKAGYALNSLFVVVIADGEYSGTVQDYLRALPHAYMNESDEVRAAVAPDGSARFGYMLMAGDFSLAHREEQRSSSASSVERICRDFAENGLSALVNPIAPVPVRTWLLDRWDEVRIRASLHGEAAGVVTTTA